jgi:splicing factor 3B subunit 3
MHLYALTLQKATAINVAINGNFSSPDADELCVAKGKLLQLLRVQRETGKLEVVCTQEMFGLIRSMVKFRLLGMKKDFLVIGSDSGRIVILDYDQASSAFVKLHQETFGKTGCRRIVPGEYLAADPKGRVICIGALER